MQTKLHLGCGSRVLEGWIHVDAQQPPGDTHIQYLTTIDNLYMFDDNSVDEIYACHVLEHIGRKDVDTVFQEWQRVVRPGGKIRVSVPDWDAIVAEYNDSKSLDSITGLLCGGQRDRYDYHNMIFNFDTLSSRMSRHGFGSAHRYDWRDFLPAGCDDYSRCYLPHMDFDGGRLMSLNVVATKE